VMTQVEMQCGPHAVVSRMSPEAAHELKLEPGSLAVAVVKATTVRRNSQWFAERLRWVRRRRECGHRKVEAQPTL
jgi:hypothetical protein